MHVMEEINTFLEECQYKGRVQVGPILGKQLFD